jgi:MSHA type pilus biogenesis protein MshL
MKVLQHVFLFGVMLLLLSACVTGQQQKKSSAGDQNSLEPSAAPVVEVAAQPAALPVKYQTASYVIDGNAADDIEIAEESILKVGARITSTQGPQPLWDIIKRLAALKGMNVSWASDVDRNVLVDVDIGANEDFYQAIDNMLRQVDYFHEMRGNTIVIRYRESRQYQISMPFTAQQYTTATGGDVLGGGEVAAEMTGTIQLDSEGNVFDVWANIKTNLDTIIAVWDAQKSSTAITEEKKTDTAEAATATTRVVQDASSFYLIDEPVGIITVTAPRTVLDKIDIYIASLKKTLYQQISIEAKIIEVQLQDNSSIGINWSDVLKNFPVTGVVGFGDNGLVYPFTYSNDKVVGQNTYSADGTSYQRSINPGQFVSSITLAPAQFGVFLNALEEQGNTKILSNPKLSVLNGQPALLSVGRSVTYIDSVETTQGTGNNAAITFTVNTAKILSGVGLSLTATILGDDEIVMTLVPITSELQEPIEYVEFGFTGGQIGLPIVNIREMSTTVRVGDGEMLVIGGLISDVEQTEGAFAPILGNIPVIRYLFGYEEKVKQKRELIILLRPRII